MQREVASFLVGLTWISVLTYFSVVIATVLRDLYVYAINKFYCRNVHISGAPELWYRQLIKGKDHGNVLFYGESAKIIVNSALCIGYIYTTYAQRLTTTIVILNRVLGIVLVIDYIQEIILANRSFLSVLRFSSFCQIFSFPSLFLEEGRYRFLNYTFLRAWAAYSSYRKLDRRIDFASATSKKYEKFVQLVIQFSVLFYMLAGGYQLFEYPGTLFGNELNQDEWNFFNSFWFIVVSLSTVGYGDISPSTIQGRVFVVFMIIITINIFYNEVTEIMTETSQNTVGIGKFRTWRKNGHIIITGAPTLNELIYFMSEFFSIYSNSRLSNENLKIVVLLENVNWKSESWYLKLSKNFNLVNVVTLLVGSYDDPISFDRACIDKAVAVFILTSSSCEKKTTANKRPLEKDKKTTNIALSIRKINSTIPIYSQALLDISKIPMSRALEQIHHEDYSEQEGTCYTNNNENNTRTTWDVYETLMEHESSCIPNEAQINRQDTRHNATFEGQEIKSEYLCLQRLFTSLLVANIKANGVGTLCTNMFFDFGLAEFESKKPWLAEYHTGAACKLLPAIISEDLDGSKISEVLPLLFRRGIILIGLKTVDCSKINSVTNLSIKLKSGQVGLFLTYLDIHHLCIAVRLVAHEYKEKHDTKLSKNFKLQHDKKSFWEHISRQEIYEGSSKTNVMNSMQNNKDSEAPISFSSNFQTLTINVRRVMDKQKVAIKALKNHVIVALDFENESEVTDRLSLFLKLLWSNDDGSEAIITPNDFVVVIHPTFWKDRSCNDRLLFVKGSPSKASSWDDANLTNARAVITMADMDQTFSVTDSSTLYTLIMLDTKAREEQNLFICSELIDEKSLRLFRVPNSRRKSQTLGTSGIVRAETVDTMETFTTQNEEVFASTERNNRVVQEREIHKSYKSDLFSSTRYTSGELLVHSTSNSLLVREFLDPGFIKFMMGLCGGSEEEPGQKIFLVDIPNRIFDDFAKPFIEFGIIFEYLVGIGVLPLALYRSGDAPVKLPKNPRRRRERGKHIKEEAFKIMKTSTSTKCCYKSQSALSSIPKEKNEISMETDEFRSSHVEPNLGKDRKSNNVLPYVYTLPDPNSMVSRNDAVYVLGDITTAIQSGFERKESSK